MYESFFQLKRRPFASTPDPACWFHCERYQAALDELLICAEQGQGIGILVGPAGVGKTLVCERLIREIGEPFTSVLLRHATFHSRRSFLQTLLSELAQPFDKGTEQELRLALLPVLRGLGQEGRALLLVVDEAHELSEPLLEELRILSDLAEDGQPLVRLVLSGQAELEDKLAHPQLQALNQRIRAHVVVTALSQAESLDYLDYRITWAGGRLKELFTEEALSQITRAADGLPRCLNQLCDHALLLAYVAEETPVSAETLAAAFEDLRHLPLAWNMPLSASAPQAEWTTNFETPTISPQHDVLEFGSTTDPVESEDGFVDLEDVAEIPHDFVEEHVDSDQFPNDSWASPELDTETASGESLQQDWNDPAQWHEEVVQDRYTSLDAGLEPPTEPEAVPWTDGWSEPTETIPESELFEATAADLLVSGDTIDERLDAVQHVLQYVSDGDQEASVRDGFSDQPSTLEKIAESGWETANSPVGDLEQTPEPALPQVYEIGAPRSSATPAEQTAVTTGAVQEQPEKRPIRNLFTLLRRKQQGRL
ncbi:AAA family ATPase [bacterium]|nr:AAA family ATPase [bacterium]